MRKGSKVGWRIGKAGRERVGVAEADQGFGAGGRLLLCLIPIRAHRLCQWVGPPSEEEDHFQCRAVAGAGEGICS